MLGLVHARQVYFLAAAVDIFRNFTNVSFWVQQYYSPNFELCDPIWGRVALLPVG